MEGRLTDREYWARYWANYKYTKVANKMIYQPYILPLKESRSFIEIGGFPGMNAIYFNKYVCKDVSLLDFYVDPEIVYHLEQCNGIPLGTIKCIETDFFTFCSDKKYDIVFSLGFIEHFDDTKDVIQRHVDLLSERGNLLVILPNFRGINGLVQWLFDPNNLKAHNLNSMKIPYLRKLLEDMELRDIRIEYTRKPMIWLEPRPGVINCLGRKCVKLGSYALKLFPIRCRFLSAYIVITARK